MRKFTMVLAFFMLCAAIFGCKKSTEDNQSNEAAALEASAEQSLAPDFSKLTHLKNFTTGRQEDSAQHISLPNHSEVVAQEEIELPAGKATLVEMKQEASAAVQSEAGDTIPDWTLYWLYMTRPISDNPLGVDTFYLQAEAIGDEAAAKDELIQFAQSWNPHATMDH